MASSPPIESRRTSPQAWLTKEHCYKPWTHAMQLGDLGKAPRDRTWRKAELCEDSGRLKGCSDVGASALAVLQLAHLPVR